MTRVGAKRIPVPSGVKVTIEKEQVRVQGPRGSLQTPVPDRIRVEQDSSDLVLHRDGEEKDIRALHGVKGRLTEPAQPEFGLLAWHRVSRPRGD